MVTIDCVDFEKKLMKYYKNRSLKEYKKPFICATIYVVVILLAYAAGCVYTVLTKQIIILPASVIGLAGRADR